METPKNLGPASFAVDNVPPPGELRFEGTLFFFFSSRRRHTRLQGDWSSDVCLPISAGANMSQPLLLWSALVALVASFLVPYVRAKAESLGVTASVGPAPREARIVIFLIGLAAWAVLGVEAIFVAAIFALAVLSTITFVLRVVHVGRQL